MPYLYVTRCFLQDIQSPYCYSVTCVCWNFRITVLVDCCVQRTCIVYREKINLQNIYLNRRCWHYFSSSQAVHSSSTKPCSVLALTQLGIRQSDWWRAGIRSTNLLIVVEFLLGNFAHILQGTWLALGHTHNCRNASKSSLRKCVTTDDITLKKQTTINMHIHVNKLMVKCKTAVSPVH